MLLKGWTHSARACSNNHLHLKYLSSVRKADDSEIYNWPGHVSQAKWFQPNPAPSLAAGKLLFDANAVDLHSNVTKCDSKLQFKMHGLLPQEREDVENLAQKSFLDTKLLEPRIKTALDQLGFTRLTSLQSHLFALLQYNASRANKTNLIVYGAPFMDAMIASILPLINMMGTVYPSKAMDLLKENQWRIQFPSLLFIFPSFFQALVCRQEMKRLTQEFYFSLYVAADNSSEFDAYRRGFQCLMGTPDRLNALLKQGLVSLKACDHVVLHGVDMIAKSYMSDVESLATHPQHGLHTNPSCSSSLLFSCERTSDSPRARHLAQMLAPRSSVTSKSTNLVKWDVAQVLPSEGVKYGVFKFPSHKERTQRFRELMKELQSLKQRVLIVWSLNPDPELWKRCGVTNHAYRVFKRELFERKCREFCDGKTPILLLHSDVLRYGIAPMPSRLDVLIHMDYSEDIVTEDTRLHRLLHPGTGVSLTLLLESDLNTSRVSTWARLMKRSDLPLPDSLAHLVQKVSTPQKTHDNL